MISATSSRFLFSKSPIHQAFQACDVRIGEAYPGLLVSQLESLGYRNLWDGSTKKFRNDEQQVEVVFSSGNQEVEEITGPVLTIDTLEFDIRTAAPEFVYEQLSRVSPKVRFLSHTKCVIAVLKTRRDMVYLTGDFAERQKYHLRKAEALDLSAPSNSGQSTK